MAKLSYFEQLKHPKWQRVRLEKLQEAGWQCEGCDEKNVTLHVHHRRYIKGRMAWEYELAELVVLCEDCHERDHSERDLLNMILEVPGRASVVAALAAGFFDATCDLDSGVGEMGRQSDQRAFELGMAAAALDLLGQEAWRKLIRDYVAGNVATPPFWILVEMWDEENESVSAKDKVDKA